MDDGDFPARLFVHQEVLGGSRAEFWFWGLVTSGLL